jgi:uncharacterized protein
MRRDLEGKTALVTGASSGLGASFAKQLAARGAAMILVARRKARLDALAEELRKEYSVEVRSIEADLAAPGSAEALWAQVGVVDVLINNAGSALHENFGDCEWASIEHQIQLDVTSLVRLTHLAAVDMRARGSGHVLNVASIGAYLPVPSFAVYAAAKAFVRNFSEAIAEELAPSGVRVCCLCPGGTDTEFFSASKQTVPGWMRLVLMSPDRCARIGLSALFCRRRNVISGWSNKLGMWSLRFLPRLLIVKVAQLVMGKRPRALPAT